MPTTLKQADYEAAAAKLNCDVAAIKAVAEVESSGSGFLRSGELKVLFEGHKFYEKTRGKFAGSHPTLCFPKWTKEHYAKGADAEVRGQGELQRLSEAMTLDKNGALQSASYGKFQIMGFNYAACGFASVEAFYEAMKQGEDEHLKAFCSFILSRRLDKALRNHLWADFAGGYNGAGYKQNRYDEKMAAAYEKYRKGN